MDVVFSVNATRTGYDSWHILAEDEKTGTYTLRDPMTPHYRNGYAVVYKTRNELFHLVNFKRVPLDPWIPASAFDVSVNESPVTRRGHRSIAPRTSYPVEIRETDPDKATVNNTFAGLVRKDDDSRVIYLDTRAACTTFALLREGVTWDRLVCPQIDKDEYTVMHSKMGGLVKHEALKTTLERENDIGALFADYCCTWEGNPDVRPREDMAIARSVVRDVIFLTLSRRGVMIDQARSVCECLGPSWQLVYKAEYSSVLALGFSTAE